MMNQTNAAPLIVELLTEELPPKTLQSLSHAFSNMLFNTLLKQQLIDEHTSFEHFATPRRLAIYIPAVRAQAPEQQLSLKVMPTHIALDQAGQPSAALKKKLQALGFADYPIEQLEKRQEDKHQVFYLHHQADGVTLQAGLQQALEQAIKHMPISKVMHYQTPSGEEIEFVRPVKGLLAIHGETVIPIHAFGLTAQNITQGHRFLGQKMLIIQHANDYVSELKIQGFVIASFEERRAWIKQALLDRAGNAHVIMPDALLDEVTALVEWPAIYTCQFDPRFLEVPQECLILTMQTNQKYFALTDQNNQLLPRFLIVSNIETDTPEHIITGNERVIRPRLADAQFFFQQDKKITLAERVLLLEKVVYHNQLGNQLQRTQRLVVISQQIAEQLQVDSVLAQRAAYLAKADLMTEMVGEFPELQGTMGAYYARHDQEPLEVALSCQEHYQPRFHGDTLPSQGVNTVIALADKLETLVGMWGIGLIPTGEKDPFALRRCALGILRILIEQKLDLNLHALIQIAFRSFQAIPAVKENDAALLAFFMERLRGLLRDKHYSFQEIESVLSQTHGQFDQVIDRLNAVHVFTQLPEASALAQANKRIGNILKKSAVSEQNWVLNPDLLHEPAEKNLFAKLQQLSKQVQDYVSETQYEKALIALAHLRDPVDHFFKDVMVNTEETALKNNRLALINQLHQSMNLVADLSKLAV